MIYLDNNATTPVHPDVIEEIARVSRDCWGNPSSIHHEGNKARIVLEESREKLSALLKVRPQEIIFTGCASESNNLALKGTAWNHGPGGHIITTEIEHPSVYESVKFLEKNGYSATYVKPDKSGRVSPESIKEVLQEDTFLVSVIYASNEIGTIQDIPAIGKLLSDRNIIFHSDGVQAFGKIPFRLYEEEIGLFSVSAHKFNGPKGVGFLFKRRDLDLVPLIHGGGQENKLRSGTENVALIAGMAKAAELKYSEMEESGKHLKKLTSYFIEKVTGSIGHVELNGDPDLRLPNTVNLKFSAVNGPKIVTHLNGKGICISPASACSSRSSNPSRVLLSLGMFTDEAFSSVRFSFGSDITKEQTDHVIAELQKTVKELWEE